MSAIKFENLGTYDGLTEWYVSVDGKHIGSMKREKPTRWGVSGLVRDRSGAWLWGADIGGEAVTIPDGSSANEAKRIMRAAIAARSNDEG